MGSTVSAPVDTSGLASGVEQASVVSWVGVGIGGLFVLVASIVLGIGNQTNVGSDIAKENYNLGGSLGLILGVAIVVYSLGWFSKLSAFANSTERLKSLTTIAIVLAATVGIFVALFYNYAPGEAFSFSTMLIVIAIIVAIFGSLFMYSGKIPIANLISRGALTFYYFAPYGFFMFGLLTDLLTKRLQFSGASFTGLTAILLNFAISKLFFPGIPGSPDPINPLCEIPGLAFLSSKIAPQSMVSILSTIAYIATYISRSTISNGSMVFAEDSQYRWPAWALFFGVFAVQSAVLGYNGCLTTGPDGMTMGGKLSLALTGSLAYGGALGAIAYSFLDSPSRGPGGTAAAPGGPVLGGTGSTTPTVGTCAAGGSDGEFICESFENGKKTTKVMTE
jgi:hypothetical protein